jgi:hypothetical protein
MPAPRVEFTPPVWARRLMPEGRLGRILVVAGVIVAVAIGAVAGWLVGGSFTERSAPRPQAPAPATNVGQADLQVATTWLPVPATKDLAGTGLGDLRAFSPYPGLPGRAWVATGPLDSASLVPAVVRKRLRGPLPAPVQTKLAGHAAWTYNHLALPSKRLLALTVVPTATTVLVVGCEGTRDAWSMLSVCAGDVQAVAGTGFVRPARTLALRRELPPAMRQLNGRRTAAARVLANAKRSRGQARAAQRLAAVHKAAAQRLAPVAPASGPGRALITDLQRTAGSYRALAAAAGKRSPRAYGRARAKVRAAERRLAATVRAAGRL